MIKKLGLCILFLITACGIYAQDTLNHRKRLFYRGDRENSISTTSYIGTQKTVDQGVSPLLYKGMTLGVGFEYQSLRKQSLWNISAALGTSSQYSSALNDKGYYQGYNLDISYRYLWSISQENKLPFSILVGLYSNPTARFRINENMFNAAVNYDIMWGLGGSLHLSKTLNIKAFNINLWKWYVHYKPHAVTFEYGLDLPLTSMHLRPSYVVIENFVSQESNINMNERIKFSSWNETFYIQSDIGFTYHLRTKNEISFKYIWQYYQILPEYSPVKGAIHMIQISFRFKLNTFDHETF